MAPVIHPGEGTGQVTVLIQNLEVLAEVSLIALKIERRGVWEFYVRPAGFEFYRQEELQASQPGSSRSCITLRAGTRSRRLMPPERLRCVRGWLGLRGPRGRGLRGGGRRGKGMPKPDLSAIVG